MSDVRLTLLGGFRATVDGDPVDLGGPRQRAVLAILAIAHGGQVSADHLTEALWPGERPTSPRASLQSYVSHLRAALEPTASARARSRLITSGAAGYALGLPADAVDGWRFRDLVAEGTSAEQHDPAAAAARLTEALGLWSGPALADYRDEAWAASEIAHLEELRSAARERLLAARLQLDDPSVLVPELEALVREAPLREEGWRLLVLAQYRAHRQADALATLRRVRRLLADEIGVDPGPALQTLERDVLAQSPDLAAAPRGPGRRTSAGPTGHQGDLLVERQREVAALEDCLHGAIDGSGAFACVEGPAGIGKSRLLAEARSRATAAGVRVLHARATQLEQEFSFGVARQLFEPVLLDPDLRESALKGAAEAAVPVFDLASLDSGKARDDSAFAMLHGLYWLTVNLSLQGPLLLVVDDVHWCDNGSLRFLAYLSKRLEGLPVLVTVAFRHGEHHALATLIEELRHDLSTVSIKPGALTRDAVGSLIESRFGETHTDFVGACFEGTSGNPLLVRQLLRELQAAAVTPDRAHADRARSLASRAVSSMVQLRLRRLGPAATAVARALAMLGDGAALPHVADLAGTSEPETARLVTALADAEIVRGEPPLGFVHPLVRDSVADDVPVGERELLHDAAARILEGSGGSDEQVAAQLLLAPRRGDPWVVEVLRRAAHEAVRRGSSDGAATLLTRALAEPPAADVCPQVLLELGLVETSTDGPAAGRDLQAAYESLTDDNARATAAIALTRTLVFVGDFGSPVRFARHALAELPDRLAEERAAVLAYQRIGGHMHGVDPATWHFDDEPSIPGDGVGSRMLQAAVAYDRMGRAAPREDAVDPAAASLCDDQLVTADPGLLWVWSQVVLDLADQDVMPMWDSILAAAYRRGSLFSVLAVGFWRAWSLLRRGDLVEAEHSIRTGIEQLGVWQRDAPTLSYGQATLARILFDQGRPAQAWAVLGDPDRPPTAIDGDRLVVQVQAELLLSDNRPLEALTRLDAVAERSPQVVNPAWRRDRVLRCLAAGRCGATTEAVGEAERLLELARRWGAPGAVGEGLLVLGRLRGRDGVEQLRESVSVLATSPRRLLQADAQLALAATLGPGDEAADLLRQVRLTGQLTGAGRLVRAADDLLQRHGTPVPAEHVPAQPRPTSTERQIVALIEAGATVHEVGQRLFLTPATIERHLESYRQRSVAPS